MKITHTTFYRFLTIFLASVLLSILVTSPAHAQTEKRVIYLPALPNGIPVRIEYPANPSNPRPVEPTPITGVGIQGPSTGYTIHFNTFTAEVVPASLTDDVEFVWNPAPDTGQGTDRATYSWAIGSEGVHTISVIAKLHGVEVGASHTVEVKRPPSPVNHLEISGPVIGDAGRTYTFNAVVGPDGTGYVMYHWEPEPLSGQRTATATYSWPALGSYTIQVYAFNPDTYSDPVSHTIDINDIERPKKQVTAYFTTLFNPDSSGECNAVAYLVLKVNGVSQTIWKDRTDRNESTVRGCNTSTLINRSISVALAAHEPLVIEVFMYEKDEYYHHTSTSARTLWAESQWGINGQQYTDGSIRAGNPWDDQDFYVTYQLYID